MDALRHRPSWRSHGMRRHRDSGGFCFGALVVLAGVIFLLKQLGRLGPYDPFDFWPLILVVIGIFKVFTPSDAPNRVMGLLFIGIGAFVQLHFLGMFDIRWGVIWPILIIVGGLHIVWASVYRKRHYKEPKDINSPHTINENVMFGGSNITNTSSAFEGGHISTAFGGFELDLRHAEIQGEVAVITTEVIFGGIEIRIPDHWEAVVKGTAMLGAYEDKTRHPKAGPDGEPKKLIVKGHAIFGGVEIKN